MLAPGRNSPSMDVVQADGVCIGLKLKIPVDESCVHLLLDLQQLSRSMISHLRDKNIGKFGLNAFNFFCCKALYFIVLLLLKALAAT